MFNPLAPKLVAELIGTFAFVFIGAAAIVSQVSACPVSPQLPSPMA
jgi:glycerol uptake facilitator-like aquaporin